jgi:late competence protein required for DNA uptake (superfamily II DNA/RNA helicase)
MPIKNNRIHQLYDYQRDIFNLLQKGEKYLWICKAGGLGISELFLRYISWKCLFNDDWKNCRVVIVTGPRMELSITLIDRMKKFFIDLGMSFSTDQTTIELNGCRIQSYPSHHVSTMRGLTDVKMIMIDEAAFFPKGEQWEVRDAAERYIAKSDPIIVMVSTPNLPSGMFFDISQEP